MSNVRNIKAIFGILRLAAVLAVALLVVPAYAADPTFPPGSLVGLVPPPGMTPSKTFVGFADTQKDSAILMSGQSEAAYDEIEKTLAPESLKREGIDVDKREQFQTSFGTVTLVTGIQVADKARYRKYLVLGKTSGVTVLANAQIPEQENSYSDAAIRAALSTLALRSAVPDEEMLGLLPFTIGDLSGFRIENVIHGRALLLLDHPTSPSTFPARMFIAAFPGGPSDADDPARFARMAFDSIAGITDVRLTMAEPLRVGGQSGYQMMAQAKDAQTGTPIMVAQWLRFGGGAFLQMIGIAPADGWTDALTRLRTVRDSIQAR
jgi:hypothetical protein